jgi:thiol:disulfide interchange protein
MRSASTRPRGSLGLGLLAAALLAIPHGLPIHAAEPASPKPARKDSSPRIRPTEASLIPSVLPQEAKVGDTITYRVTAKLEPGWHIYAYSRKPNADGPRNTSFDLFDTAGLKVVGEWTPSRPPTREKEPAFPQLPFLEFYEDEVAWSLTLQVPPGTEPGNKTLRAQAGYQICNAQSCKIPGQWTLPEVVLTVLPGGAPAASTVPESPSNLNPGERPGEVAKVVPTVIPGGKPEASAAPETPSNPNPKEGISEVARQAELGLIPFLLFSALGGLGALVMPCVWPMVPITVNFFVKQGQNSGRTTGLAITYCLAIIGVFTSIGVLCSFFFSAAALQNLANNPWLNTMVALLFVLFGLSLLGVFEIRLPNFLLNASAQGESRGGLVGVIFMALTLTITSFTCTFPVVGGLIVMAARGQFFYPILGLATFSTVLALPFFLLAMAPGLLSRMPRSGDWMNTVKVVGGLIELGAAFKFVNTAEIGFGAVPEEAWFNAPVVLSIWVVLAAVCGAYLLGLFRTDHDQEEIRVGPGRILIGSLFLGIALFLSPALFGRAPQSNFWYVMVGLLPPDAKEFTAPTMASAGPGNVAGCQEVKAQSNDPSTAEREQKNCHGVQWGMSFEAAQEQAKAEGRPILIDFTGVNCANCRTMETGVMPRPEIVKLLEKFVTVQLYTDFVPIGSLRQDQREELAAKNQERLLALGEATNPYYVAIGSDGKILDSIGGYRPASAFAAFLDKALAKQSSVDKVAQAGSVR